MIISDGVSVRGINTAATLWCAAAVGALSASGFIWQAGVATAAILAINILLRPLGAGSTANPLTMTPRSKRSTASARPAETKARLERNVTSVRWNVVERDGRAGLSADGTTAA